jgi:hypothetical protein
MTRDRDHSPARADQDTGNKYFLTRALEWFDGIKNRFWTWLFDEENHHRRPTAILYFLLGAAALRLAPDAFYYAGVVAGALIILALAIAFLIPVWFLVEWALRTVSGR